MGGLSGLQMQSCMYGQHMDIHLWYVRHDRAWTSGFNSTLDCLRSLVAELQGIIRKIGQRRA